MIHDYYLKLTANERAMVDDVAHQTMQRAGIMYGIHLDGSDPAERAVEGLARWVVESRS